MTATLFAEVVPVWSVAEYLDANHYLGSATRGFAWSDEFGVAVLASPTSRHLPHDRWLELSRWCLTGEPNAGSRQWARIRRYLHEHRPDVTTVVSYSDRSAGHSGALYKASGWIAAPTWHALRPPPSGGGSWDGVTKQEPKDRWVFPLRHDADRERLLAIQDDALRRKMPEREYREPTWRGKRWSAA